MPSVFHAAMNASDQLIHLWLKERENLIIHLNELCLLRPFVKNARMRATLEEFCDLLIDYVSRGHFTVFEQMTYTLEIGHSNTPFAALMARIAPSTSYAVAFYDKYCRAESFSHLEADLSKLAEQLAQRWSSEDDLLTHYRMAKAWSLSKIA